MSNIKQAIMNHNQYNTGFTLIELMIAVALVGIVSAFAFPSYQTMIKNNCLTATTNNLIANLQFARSEAIKQRQQVTIASKSGGWDKGWQITNAAGAVIRDIIPTSCGKTTITSFSNSFIYRFNGLINSSGTFRICDDRTAETGRQISINLVGRANSSYYSGCS